MKIKESVTKIMKKNPRAIAGNTKISEAAELLKELNIHHLPVTSGRKLIGMFSYSDLLALDFSAPFNQDARSVFAVLDSEKHMEEVMTTDLTVLNEKQSIGEAADLLSTGEFHSLPVVNDANDLVGIVTSTDLIRYLADLCR
ncbi:MAG: CBS domain-containing protein [Bdellovibrionales bacterium]|nr:CBS domain-containing protein [Bdellovibrionales bacterium]